MKALEHAAKMLGVKLKDVDWHRRVIPLDKATLAEVDGQLRKLSRDKLERYIVCVAAVADLNFERYQEPLLESQCGSIRKRLCEHDVVETALECIACARKRG